MSEAVKLRIDADTAKAVQQLNAGTTAQEKLSQATKKGAAVSREAAQADAAQAKARGTTTAATTAAAKSTDQLTAAIRKQKEEQKTAMGFAKLSGVAQLKADADQRKRIQRHRDEAVALRSQASSMGTVTSAAARMSAGLKGIAAVGAGVVGALAALERQFTVMLEKQARANKQATNMKDFVAALPQGPEGVKFAKETSVMGARFGIAPEQSAALAGPLMAAADSDGSGKLEGKEKANYKLNFAGGAIMQRVGVSEKAATDLILAGQAKGQSGVKTASQTLKASEISMRGPKVFADSAGTLVQFNKMEEGLSMLTALSASGENEQMLPQRLKDVQLTLSSAADQEEFSKKHGLAGLGEMEKLKKLRAAAVASGDVKAFTDQFQNQGLDEGKALGMAQLVQQGDRALSTVKVLREMDPGFAMSKLRALEQNPMTESMMAQEKAVSAFKHNDIFGPGSAEARDAFNRELAMGNELQKHGGDQAVDPETALPKRLNVRDPGGSWDRIVGTAKAALNGMPILGRPGSAGGGPAPEASQELARTQQELILELRKNNDLLARNNAVTEANTGAGRSARPVGGAASNAEEKY